MTIRRPALKGYGSKFQMAPWIVSNFPRHDGYLDAFWGTGSVTLRKPVEPHEVANDKDGRIYNYFVTLRDRKEELIQKIEDTPWHILEHEVAHERSDDQLEDARRVFVLSWMSIRGYAREGTHFRLSKTNGSRGLPAIRDLTNHDLRAIGNRIRNIQFVSEDALESNLLERFDKEGVLIYVDPPYLDDVRTVKSASGGYFCDMGDEGSHALLAERLLRLKNAMVVLSHINCGWYDNVYLAWDWDKTVMTARQNSGSNTQEALYLNQKASANRYTLL